MPELWRVAIEAWGATGLHEAQRRFYTGYEVPADPEADSEFDSLFLTCQPRCTSSSSARQREPFRRFER